MKRASKCAALASGFARAELNGAVPQRQRSRDTVARAAALVATWSTLASTVLCAQENAGGGLEEIVVTAQRREESLQRAAIPVSAVTGDALINAGVSATENLTKLVPALVVQPSGGSGMSMYLRGVGAQSGNSYAENAVAFNFNGIYVARPTAPVGTFFDLERIEVLKGPQGTLYGRNATGGAVNVLPKRPRLNDLGGDVTLEYGDYEHKQASAALNVPLGDSVALRVAGQHVERDGYLSDGTQDEQGTAGRMSLLVQPSSAWSALLVGDYFKQGGRGNGSILAPGQAFPSGEFPGYSAPALDERIGGSDPRSVAALAAFAQTRGAPPFCGGFGGLVASGCVAPPANDSYLDNEYYGFSATLEGDVGFGQLTLIPAYRKTDVDFRSYLPGFRIEIDEEAEQTSLEVRLASDENQRLRHVLGVYYFSEDQDSLNFFYQGELATTRFAPQLETESKAVFGQATFDVTDTFRLVAGARYTEESKEQLTTSASGGRPGAVSPPLGAPFAGSLDFSKTTWKAGIEWDAGPDSLVYANVATGFKSGGFFTAAPPVNTFAPEFLTAYTVGTKNRFLDDRLQLNLEVFYWDYEDQQITFVGGVNTANGVQAGGITVNAGQARMYGSELELMFALTPVDLVTTTVQYLDGKYDEFLFTAFSNTGAPLRSGCTTLGSRLANPGTASAARLYDVDCSGQQTINSPEWTANVGYQHTFTLGGDMGLVFGAQSRLESSRYLALNYLPETRQGSYTTTDAFLRLEGSDNRWALTAYVSNLEDEEVLANAGLRPILDTVYVTLRPPRTYGVRGTLRF